MNACIALAQFNPTIGAMEKNASKLLAMAEEATSKGAQLMIAPELAICGYPPKDILLEPDCLSQIEESLVGLAKKASCPILLGAPIQRQKGSLGLALHNGAVLCHQGNVQVVAQKNLLPNYGEFNERRYFEPKEKDFQGKCNLLGPSCHVLICEDVWNDPEWFQNRKYIEDPVFEAISQGAKLLICIAASPFAMQKPAFRLGLFCHLAKKYKVPLINVGQVGANDQLLFDGGTLCCNKQGEVVLQAPLFEECLEYIQWEDGNLKPLPKKLYPAYPVPNTQLVDALCLGISDYMTKCHAPGVLVGLSGGLDSAVVAALAARALGKERILGVRMPSKYSSLHSLEDAQELAEGLGIQLCTAPIEPMVAACRVGLEPLSKELGHWSHTDTVDQNVQARMRGLVLMALSNALGYFVLATSNKSELAVGYSTLYGDLCGAIAPLGDVYKTQVLELAKHLIAMGYPIPKRIIEKAPSAELLPNQRDDDTLPPYAQLDPFLGSLLDCQKTKWQLSKTQQQQMALRILGNEYKRKQAPLVLQVSEHAFESSRFWPCAHGFSWQSLPTQKSS